MESPSPRSISTLAPSLASLLTVFGVTGTRRSPLSCSLQAKIRIALPSLSWVVEVNYVN
jgi:hypothetical protein